MRQILITKDTGWAWMVWFASFISIFLKIGILKSLSVLLPHLQEKFSTQTWVIGLMISIASCFGSLICPFVAAISKRFSTRKTVMVLGALPGLGLILGSVTTYIEVISISLLLTGFGTAAEALLLGALSNYFDKKYDSAVAFAHIGVAMSFMVMPSVTQLLFDVYGLQGAMLILGGISLHVIVCGVLVRPITTYDEKLQNKSTNTSEQHTTNSKDILHNLGMHLFKNIDFVLVIWMSGGCSYFSTSWIIYLVPHAITAGFEPYQATLLSTVGGATTIVGNMLLPILSTKLSSKQLLYLSMLVSSLGIFIDPISAAFQSYTGMMTSCAVLGVGKGLLYPSLYKRIHEIIDDETVNVAVTWINVASSLGSLASGFLSGWLFDKTGTYVVSFVLLGSVPLLSLCPQLILDILQNIGYSSVSQSDLDED